MAVVVAAVVVATRRAAVVVVALITKEVVKEVKVEVRDSYLMSQHLIRNGKMMVMDTLILSSPQQQKLLVLQQLKL
jgi:hypothetical protein